MGGYSAALIANSVGGMVASDALGAVPVTKAGANTPTLVDGTPVAPANPTARQHLYMSAVLVIIAAAILLCGARFLRNAKIA